MNIICMKQKLNSLSMKKDWLKELIIYLYVIHYFILNLMQKNCQLISLFLFSKQDDIKILIFDKFIYIMNK